MCGPIPFIVWREWSEISRICASEREPAPGISRSMTNCGMIDPVYRNTEHRLWRARRGGSPLTLDRSGETNRIDEGGHRLEKHPEPDNCQDRDQRDGHPDG